MTAPYEAELRVRIPRIEDLRARLDARGARRVTTYAFTDHYFHPATHRWPPTEKTLRIREHASGEAEVLFSRIALVDEGGIRFKRSGLVQGKLMLHRGTVDECRALLEALGFVPWLRVRKLQGEILEIPDVGLIACEEIEGSGWWVEVEVAGVNLAEAAAALRARLDAVGIDPRDASPLPAAALMAAGGDGRRVYFCGAIRGGRRLQPRYARFIAALRGAGWTVLTPHVGDPDVLAREPAGPTGSAEILDRDMVLLAACDLVVAEVTVPSLGVGIEVAGALARGLPVIALAEAGAALSALVEGDGRIRLIRYESESQAVAALLEAASAGRP